tara:strand:- start:633 stop:1676 length:1044 start_codon:yes stop_codon:yes gene_type:complete
MSKITLGICGSGQLSMMLCQAARKLDVKTVVLTDDKNGPAKRYCDEFFLCNLSQEKEIKEFAKKTDVVTLEFENFNFKILKLIEKFVPVFPRPEINRIVQNRNLEKEFFKSLKIPTTEYLRVDKQEDLTKISHLIPGILKSDEGGYDGHFSYKIENLGDLEKIKIDFKKRYIFEKKVNFKKEISIIAARYQDKKINIFEPFENFHQNQILKTTTVPAKISSKIKNLAEKYTHQILEKHDYTGVMAIEFFLDYNEELLANETASRVHNSGHITLDNSNSSQFDQHVRAVCNLDYKPLEKMKRGKMYNILGNEILKYREEKKNVNEFFFDYEKKEIRPKRKMGHLNIIE